MGHFIDFYPIIVYNPHLIPVKPAFFMLPTLTLLVQIAMYKPQFVAEPGVELASRKYSLENRYSVPTVNQVFKNNILLTLKYMDGSVKSKTDVNWVEINKPFHSEFTLKPGEGFAFHDQILPEYKDSIRLTTNAHFNSTDGFLSDGWLYGDGVCHLASFMHVVALEAGLISTSLASHDFAKINEVPREFGVSIKYMPGEFANSARQNLYITNTLDKPITFVFDYNGADLIVKIIESSI